MPESKELHQKVDEILRHVQSMDGQMSWLIRSNDSGLRDLFIKYFADHSISAKVFLSIDGRKRVKQISKELDIVQPNVSRSISELVKIGLLDLLKRGLYRKNKIDEILGISDELRKKEEYADIK